ncbi:hypothetical protein [Hymenobacter arizonensis]|nr:hypothetical protein [Hymenobacter arizonensis]
MTSALQQLVPFLGEEYQATVVLGAPNEIAVVRGGRCVAAIALTVAEFGVLVRAVPVPQQYRPVRELHRALHLDRLRHRP